MYNSSAILDSLSLIQCYDIDVKKVKIGSSRDGGYIYADRISELSPIISLGVSDNCDFEYEMAEKGHPIYMFDYSVDMPPKQHHRFEFHKKKVVGSETDEADCVTLPQIIQRLNFDKRQDLILKMDIEGAEFEVLANCPRSLLRQFEQIAVEIHWLSNLIEPEYRALFDAAMAPIAQNFTIFHVHGNNCGQLSIIGGVGPLHKTGGITVVDVLELSCIRNDLAVRSDNQTLYPTHLDMPNHPQFPDHMLLFYPFLPNSTAMYERMRALCKINDLNYIVENRT